MSNLQHTEEEESKTVNASGLEEELSPRHQKISSVPLAELPLQSASPQATNDQTSGLSGSSSDGSDHEEVPEVVIEPPPPPPPQHSMATRARSGIVKPNPKYALFTVKTEYREPKKH